MNAWPPVALAAKTTLVVEDDTSVFELPAELLRPSNSGDPAAASAGLAITMPAAPIAAVAPAARAARRPRGVVGVSGLAWVGWESVIVVHLPGPGTCLPGVPR